MMTELEPQIVVVDDEKYICSIIEASLVDEGYPVITFSDPAKALEYIAKNPVDLVLTDLVMGDYSGVQILDKVLAHHDDGIVILMTAHPTVETAIVVLKKGGYDFLVKPFKLDVLKATIKRGLAHQQLRRENLRLKSQVEFLKVANSYGVGQSIDDYLRLVLNSCRTEFSAVATGIVGIDRSTGEISHHVYSGDDRQYFDELTSEENLSRFDYSKSNQPHVKVKELSRDGEQVKVTTIHKPIFVRRTLTGVISVRVEDRFGIITPGKLDVLSILANSASSALANNKLYNDLQQSYLEAINAMAAAIEARDQCTSGHTDRVIKLAELVAIEMNWDKELMAHLAMGCTLHDIGKLGVPDSILNKPGRLTDDETAIMREHPELGLKIVDGIAPLKPAIPYIIAHHERYDGNGYPHKLAGEEIPVEGRLLSVVDTFDAIMSDRPYRKGAPLSVAIKELIDHSGTQFDPEVVKAFIKLLLAGKLDMKSFYDREFDLSELDDLLKPETELV